VTPSLIALVIANALPLVGVLLLGWTVFPLVLLYWLENLVVGGFNVAKLLLAQPRQPVYRLGRVFLIPFFVVHFGGFTYIHGVLVVARTGRAAQVRTVRTGIRYSNRTRERLTFRVRVGILGAERTSQTDRGPGTASQVLLL